MDGLDELEVLESIWRRQDAEELLVASMTDEEFYAYREKVYGIPVPDKQTE